MNRRSESRYTGSTISASGQKKKKNSRSVDTACKEGCVVTVEDIVLLDVFKE